MVVQIADLARRAYRALRPPRELLVHPGFGQIARRFQFLQMSHHEARTLAAGAIDIGILAQRLRQLQGDGGEFAITNFSGHGVLWAENRFWEIDPISDNEVDEARARSRLLRGLGRGTPVPRGPCRASACLCPFRRGQLDPEKVKGDLAMRTLSTAILGLFVLSACLEPARFSVARGDGVPPAKILKNKGLERQRGTPSNWSLASEADVLSRFRMARNLYKQLAAVHEAQQQLEMGGQNPQAMINGLQMQINMGNARIAEIDKQLTDLGGAGGNLIVNYHNLLVNEQNSIVYEQRRLNAMINNLARQGGDLEQQRREFNAEVRRLRDSAKEAVDELRNSIENIQKKYVDAGKDVEITEALADLSASTRLKQKLGPSKDLQEAMNWLKRAQSDGSGRGSRTKSGRRR